jgi:ketosteroid isomerase-like protein
MSEQNERVRSIVEGYFDAIAGVDDAAIARALDCMSDDVVWINPASIDPVTVHKGKDAVRALLTSAIADVYEPNSLKSLKRETLVEGNRAVTLYDTQATTTAGRDYRNHFAIEFEVDDDGKLSYIRENFDSLLFHTVVYGDAD